MKALFMYCRQFAYTPTIKTYDGVGDDPPPAQFLNAQVAFLHVEQEDTEKGKVIESKLVNYLKWICRKNGTNKLILHSFAHLSESKAGPEFTMLFFNRVEERMRHYGFEVYQTPFGYFLDLHLNAPGFSLARVFQSIT
jgi:hypothetical protein